MFFTKEESQIAKKNRVRKIFTFEKSLSGGPQKSIGNIMYGNKKIDLIIDIVQKKIHFFETIELEGFIFKR